MEPGSASAASIEKIVQAATLLGLQQWRGDDCAHSFHAIVGARKAADSESYTHVIHPSGIVIDSVASLGSGIHVPGKVELMGSPALFPPLMP